MRRQVSRVLAVLLCVAVSVSTAAICPWSPRDLVRTEDRNGDGRPDVWRSYDRQGQLTQVAFDTNFDGRSDVLEYYDQGALVRRDTDRNFDGRVDLIESFDRITHERVRAIADVDYDGRADLLVLFHHGRAVYSKWAAPGTPTGRPARDSGLANRPPAVLGSLESLDDPFRADLAVEGVSPARGPEDGGALTVSSGMPAPRVDGVTSFVPSSRVSTSDLTLPSSASAGPCSPRGPPASALAG
jgi:hypothetical protein